MNKSDDDDDNNNSKDNNNNNNNNEIPHYEMLRTEKWYEHTPEPIAERKKVTIIWEFTVQADRKLDANRPDITIKNHEERTCILMDVAVTSKKRGT